jgi:anthranilate 1,2-dioxygenase small subunit
MSDAMSGEREDAASRILLAQAAYARCIDNGELERWPEFFAEACTYKITTADNHAEGLEAGIVFANSRAMLVDRVTSLRSANVYERQAYRHILGLPHIAAAEGGRARSETPFLVVRIVRDGATDIFASGRYLDLYTLAEDPPKLIERIVVCDSARFDTLLALPL